VTSGRPVPGTVVYLGLCRRCDSGARYMTYIGLRLWVIEGYFPPEIVTVEFEPWDY
jgi:hypothetical protein